MTIASANDVSRLYARFAFAATPGNLRDWTGKQYEAVVEHVLAPGGLKVLAPTEVPKPYLSPDEHWSVQLAKIQVWWLEQMRTTNYPAKERLGLLWHDHFATAFDGEEPSPQRLLDQNKTLRALGLGNFSDLAGAITIDPAMLFWLDGVTNVHGQTNENYAREFLELFSLGMRPMVHTEKDVREAARVLTGWTVDGGVARFAPALHDTGTKFVLGRQILNRGKDEYRDLIGAALAQPAAARHVASVLVAGLAYVPDEGDSLVEQVADSLVTSGWNITSALRTLALAPEFRSAAARQHVRQPIEVIVASAKALGVPLRSFEGPVLTALTRMDQLPFRPPNVGGWKEGDAWLSATGAVARYDWGFKVLELWTRTPQRPGLPAIWDLGAWARQFGLAGFSSSTTSTLNAYLVATRNTYWTARYGGMIALILSSPDWMVI